VLPNMGPDLPVGCAAKGGRSPAAHWTRIGLAIVVAAATAVGGSGAVLPVSRDHILAITCAVSDKAGHPVEGAEVRVWLGGDRTTADPAASKTTPQMGSVVFMFHAPHPTSWRYVLVVGGPGYEDARADGVAATGKDGTHVPITLVRAGRGVSGQ